MNKILRTILPLILIFSTFFTSISAAENNLINDIQKTANSLQESFDSKEKYILSDENILPAGGSASDWSAMVLAFSQETNAYRDYLERLENYVADQYEKQGYLDAVKATEYHRIALTMLALGGNPANIQTKEQTINLIADGTWNFYGGSPAEQGSNGLIYALLLLNAKDDFLPAEQTSFRDEMIQALLEYQDDEGGFSLNHSFGAGLDMTAMAVQALEPYQNDNNVNEAVQKALSWISENIFQTSSSESVSQTLLALCALGISPEEDARFIQDEQTLLDLLNTFKAADSMYRHQLQDETSNLVSTYQALLAMEAVYKLDTEGTWIFDFRTYEFSEEINSSAGNLIPILLGAGVSTLIAALLLLRNRKKA